MSLALFTVLPPRAKSVPILISSPHSGVGFPAETGKGLMPQWMTHPPDTDWFVNRLYDFAPDMGITMICANYSRYVIDLNRDPKGANLYNDGRAETALVPITTFSGEAIYLHTVPTKEEVEDRLRRYYWPYYTKIEELLRDLLSRHRQVLFYDAHSIRHQVSCIQTEAFADLMLGDQNGKTAAPKLIDTALINLKSSTFSIGHNHPFKGGHLTRFFGRPENGIHALQLEMSQTVYMDEDKTKYLPEKAERIRKVLKATLTALANQMENLS